MKLNVHKWDISNSITVMQKASSLFLLFLPLRPAGLYTLTELTGVGVFLPPYVFTVSTDIA